MAKAKTAGTPQAPAAAGQPEDIEGAIEILRDEIVLCANRTNPHFKSRYLDFNGLIDAIRPVFRRLGMTYRYELDADSTPGVQKLRLLITFALTGEVMTSSVILPASDQIHKTGGAITYLKRYLLTTALGVPVEPDDDGNIASEQKAREAKAAYEAAVASFHTRLKEAKTLAELKAAWEAGEPSHKQHAESVPLRDKLKAKLK